MNSLKLTNFRPTGLLAAVLALSHAAWADTDTANLTVTANVANQCAIGDATLAMGTISLVNINGTMGAPSGGGTANVPWACTNGTSATVGFGYGQNSTGTDRRLRSVTAGSSNQYLEYVLRTTNSSGTVISGSAFALSGADGTDKVLTIWGGPVDTPANRAVKPASDYTDSVVMTITFTP